MEEELQNTQCSQLESSNVCVCVCMIVSDYDKDDEILCHSNALIVDLPASLTG
jgi:hypothetical protein